jgi:hypothetical protein
VLPLVLLSGGHKAMVKSLPVSQLYRSSWLLLVLDAIPVRVGDRCGWWWERYWRRIRGKNDGEFIIGKEEEVLIAVVVGVNNGKMPVVGTTGVRQPSRMVAPA